RPGGPTFPLPVAEPPDSPCLFTHPSFPLPRRAAMGERARERGLCSPISAWFWCVRDRDEGVMPIFHDPTSGEVTLANERCDRLTHPTG
ncbi:MAG: hypothetical protein ACK43N_11020, partial [Pirellulaceae bacterium]